MSRKLSVVAFALVLVAGVTRTSHAYIDPGTGMTFVSGIGAIVAAFFAAFFGFIAVTFKKWMAAIRTVGAAVKRLFQGRPSA